MKSVGYFIKNFSYGLNSWLKLFFFTPCDYNSLAVGVNFPYKGACSLCNWFESARLNIQIDLSSLGQLFEGDDFNDGVLSLQNKPIFKFFVSYHIMDDADLFTRAFLQSISVLDLIDLQQMIISKLVKPRVVLRKRELNWVIVEENLNVLGISTKRFYLCVVIGLKAKQLFWDWEIGLAFEWHLYCALSDETIYHL